MDNRNNMNNNNNNNGNKKPRFSRSPWFLLLIGFLVIIVMNLFSISSALRGRTEFVDYSEFLKSYEADEREYSGSKRYTPKAGTPENSFNISMLPWLEFTSVNINVFDDGKFLLPIFTMGKYFERDGRRMLPLSIQVHHAVCDGYHVGVFVDKLQDKINRFAE